MSGMWSPVKQPGRGWSRLGLRAAVLVLGLLAAQAAVTLRAATFTATLDRDTISVGESATLSLKFEGGEPDAIPSPPAIENLQIQAGMSGHNISIFNGQAS